MRFGRWHTHEVLEITKRIFSILEIRPRLDMEFLGPHEPSHVSQNRQNHLLDGTHTSCEILQIPPTVRCGSSQHYTFCQWRTHTKCLRPTNPLLFWARHKRIFSFWKFGQRCAHEVLRPHQPSCFVGSTGENLLGPGGSANGTNMKFLFDQ